MTRSFLQRREDPQEDVWVLERPFVCTRSAAQVDHGHHCSTSDGERHKGGAVEMDQNAFSILHQDFDRPGQDIRYPERVPARLGWLDSAMLANRLDHGRRSLRLHGRGAGTGRHEEQEPSRVRAHLLPPDG